MAPTGVGEKIATEGGITESHVLRRESHLRIKR